MPTEELATRSSAGLLVFVPEAYDKEVIAQSGLRLLLSRLTQSALTTCTKESR
jgi:hypothetical protein